MEISTPIKFGDKNIGVIGLLCSDEKQKKHLLENMSNYLQFLIQISDFISTKVYENSENQRNKKAANLLRQIVDSVDKGIVVVNHKDEIIHINEVASKQLGIWQFNVKKSIDISRTNEYISDEEIYYVNVDGRQIKVVGKLIPASSLFFEFDRIFIFTQLKKARNDTVYTYQWQPITIDDIQGKSQAINIIKEKIKKIASSKSTVLITGESGTGKEIIARAIHSESDRRNEPFIAINCGAIPEALLESELFGYVRGAFSGADPNGRIGKFELANGGFIFLDEIGDIPMYLQVKLLRVLQERKLTRIGSNKMIELDIRVIAATNMNLKQRIEENKFRKDLYYRLNVIPMEIPPLRERKEDIESLLMKIIEKYNKLFNTNIKGLDREAKSILEEYNWPGNIRELENAIEFMINMSDRDDILDKSTIPENIKNYKIGNTNDINIEINKNEIISLKEIEKKYIIKAIELCGNDTRGKKLAAKKLGIGIATLYRKLEEYQLSN